MNVRPYPFVCPECGKHIPANHYCLCQFDPEFLADVDRRVQEACDQLNGPIDPPEVA